MLRHFLFCVQQKTHPLILLLSLPFLLVLLDYWPLGRLQGCSWGPGDRTFAELLREKIPFFVMVLALGMVTYFVGKAGGIVKDQDMVPFKFRLVNSLNSYYEYLRQFVWPNRLYAQYDFQLIFPWSKMLLAAGVLTGISIVAVRRRLTNPYLLTGWLWYLGSLIPVLGLVQQGVHSMADRYMYTSLIGIFMIVVWGVADIGKKFRVKPWLVAGATVCVVVGLTWTARIQAAYWRDTETLFFRTFQMDPDNNFALTKLGDLYKETGRTDEAKDMYERSIRGNPHAAASLNNLASILADEGKWAKALALYNRALVVTSDDATVHYNMGILLNKMGRYDEAVDSYEKALEHKADLYDAVTNLGLTYLELGRYNEAVNRLESLLAARPEDPVVRYNLACVFSRSEQIDKALYWLRESVDLGFDDWETLATDPDLAKLRVDPGFLAMGLPVPQ